MSEIPTTAGRPRYAAPFALITVCLISLSLPGWMSLFHASGVERAADMGRVYGLVTDSEFAASQHPRQMAALVAVSLGGMIAGFLWALRVARRTPDAKAIGAGTVLFALLAFAGPTALSTDTITYAAQGLAVARHLNPYREVLITPDDLPISINAPKGRDLEEYLIHHRIERRGMIAAYLDPWHGRHTAYGFFWTHLMGFNALWLGASVVAQVYGFKLIGLAAHIAILILLWKLTEEQDSKPRALALALYGLNPAAFLETAMMGHCEGLMLALWLASAFALRKRQPLWAGALLGLAAGVKWIPLFTAPIWHLSIRSDEKSPRHACIHFSIAFLAALILPSLYFSPWDSHTWSGLREQSRLFGGGSLPMIGGLLMQSFTHTPESVPHVASVLRFTVLLALITLIWRHWRRRELCLFKTTALISLLLALGAATFFQPWYALWALPWAILARQESPRLCAAVIALSLAAPLSLVAPIAVGSYAQPIQFVMFAIWVIPTVAAFFFFRINESTNQPINSSPPISSSISNAI